MNSKVTVNLFQPRRPCFEAGAFSPANSTLSGEKAAAALPMRATKPDGGRAEKGLSPEQVAALKAEVKNAAKGSADEKKQAKMDEKQDKKLEQKGNKPKPPKLARGMTARLAAQKVLASLVTSPSGSSGSKGAGKTAVKTKTKGKGKGKAKKTITKGKGKGKGKRSAKAGSTFGVWCSSDQWC